jgi:hypothetical protein
MGHKPELPQPARVAPSISYPSATASARELGDQNGPRIFTESRSPPRDPIVIARLVPSTSEGTATKQPHCLWKETPNVSAK